MGATCLGLLDLDLIGHILNPRHGLRNFFRKSLRLAVLNITFQSDFAILDRYLNVGVAEQNMVGVAAGLAKAGLRPILYGLSAFVPVRVLEQIKLDICYEELPVVMIGDGAGFVYGALGASHHCTEDISALRAIPNVRILSPADAHEMTRAMELAFSLERPVYIRIGKCDIGAVHERVIEYDWGELIEMRAGDGDLGFIATGPMVKAALKEAARWVGSSVWSAPSLKPLNAKQVIAICHHHRAIVTLEEHSIYGGLGAAIAEISSTDAPCWIGRIGVQDRFAQYAGSYEYLRSEHGLDASGISRQVDELMARIDNANLRNAQSFRTEILARDNK